MAKLKLTKELCDNICDCIRAGVPIKHAVVAHGICTKTFYNWYNKGKSAKSGQYKHFYDRVEQAKSEGISLGVKRLHAASEKDWRSIAWWLERIDREHFGKYQQLDVNADVKSENKGFENLIQAFETSKKEWIKNKEEMKLFNEWKKSQKKENNDGDGNYE